MTPERMAEIKGVALPSSHILGPMALELITELEYEMAANEQADKIIAGLTADNTALKQKLAQAVHLIAARKINELQAENERLTADNARLQAENAKLLDGMDEFGKVPK